MITSNFINFSNTNLIYLTIGSLGLDKFSAYVCGIVSSHCKKAMKVATEQSAFNLTTEESHSYVDLMTRLFEVVATMIDQQEDMVESHYGPGSMHIVILRLQREVDVQSSILLNGFKEYRQVERKVYKCSMYRLKKFEKSRMHHSKMRRRTLNL